MCYYKGMANVTKIPDIIIGRKTARLNTYDARYWYYTSTNARDVVDCHYSPESLDFPVVVKLPDNLIDRFEIILESSGDGLTVKHESSQNPYDFRELESLQLRLWLGAEPSSELAHLL